MDRIAVMAAHVPDDAAWQDMTPADRTLALSRGILAVAEAIEAEGRPPDRWEALRLAEAIGYTSIALCDQALGALRAALLDPADRSELSAEFDPPSIEQLKDGAMLLRGVRWKPASVQRNG